MSSFEVNFPEYEEQQKRNFLKNLDNILTLDQKLDQLKSLKILPPKHVHLKINIYSIYYLRDNKKMILSSTIIKEVLFWLRKRTEQLFHEYFSEWVELYKVGAIRDISLQKYYIAEQWLAELAPGLKVKHLDRQRYQQLLNDYALTHERQTTMDFHHQLKGAILDAVDEGLISKIQHEKLSLKEKHHVLKIKIFKSI